MRNAQRRATRATCVLGVCAQVPRPASTPVGVSLPARNAHAKRCNDSEPAWHRRKRATRSHNRWLLRAVTGRLTTADTEAAEAAAAVLTAQHWSAPPSGRGVNAMPWQSRNYQPQQVKWTCTGGTLHFAERATCRACTAPTARGRRPRGPEAADNANRGQSHSCNALGLLRPAAEQHAPPAAHSWQQRARRHAPRHPTTDAAVASHDGVAAHALPLLAHIILCMLMDYFTCHVRLTHPRRTHTRLSHSLQAHLLGVTAHVLHLRVAIHVEVLRGLAAAWLL